MSVSPGPGAAPEVFPDYYEEGAVASDKKVKPHAQAHLLSATEHCKVRGELELETNCRKVWSFTEKAFFKQTCVYNN